jgi:hypothetical protein
MQTLALRNPPMIGSVSAKCDVVASSYGLASFGPLGSSHLAKIPPKLGRLPRPLISTVRPSKHTSRYTKAKKRVLTCQAAPSATSQAPADASPAAATTAAYSKLQNGSDIRGVALDRTYYLITSRSRERKNI